MTKRRMWVFVAFAGAVATTAGGGGCGSDSTNGGSPDAASGVDGAFDVVVAHDGTAPADGSIGTPDGSGGDGPPPFMFDGSFFTDGSAACDGSAVDAPDSVCAFSGSITGLPMTPTWTNVGCGTASSGNFHEIDWDDLEPSVATYVRLDLSGSFPLDMTGPIPVGDVNIQQSQPDGGPNLAWQTPAGACTATIASTECAPTPSFNHRRVFTGTGSCTQAAAPVAGNPNGPVTLSSFSFTGFVDP
jgi:hypothetical protein